MLERHSRIASCLQDPPATWETPGVVSLSPLILDHLSIAIAVLDVRGMVLFCNDCAKQLVERPGLAKVSEGRYLRFRDDGADQKFQAALRRFSDRNPTRGDSATVVAEGVDSCDLPLIVTLRVLSENPRSLLAILTDCRYSPAETNLECLMQTFHLTRAEQRLTLYLTSGGCLGDAANSFGVSRHTVRNQLRSIFEKVGVQRQADLTRLMLAGSAHGGTAQAIRN